MSEATVAKNVKDQVLLEMIDEIEKSKVDLMKCNQTDLEAYSGKDQAMYDRLVISDKTVKGMIRSLNDVINEDDPVNKLLYAFTHDNGMRVENRTVPFGTIMIIYESRPDVTIEAAAISFKSGNKVILKGGKEAINSNLHLFSCWQNALKKCGMPSDMVRYLDYNREQTQEFLRNPDAPIDLIIPRGGEKLIQFVKSVAHCPVLVSGRGNNFLYVSDKADLEMARSIILSAKISKISACNALDKVLVHEDASDQFMEQLINDLSKAGVEIVKNPNDEVWQEEFLAMKIVVEKIRDLDSAIQLINSHSGGHSCSIITTDESEAHAFMERVDAAAVYHNASTRFTDGGQFGLGAEMAISTEKMHHRGPLGLEQLVTNKWYVYGAGQER